MITVKITTEAEVRTIPFSFDNETFKGNGEVRISNNAIKQVNGTLYKGGAYAGNFSSSNMIEGEESKFNINGVASEDLAQVAELVNGISVELKAKYSI